MNPKKTLREREMELRAMLLTPAGLAKLHDLAASYAEAGDRVLHERGSLITYILVHERTNGLIVV